MEHQSSRRTEPLPKDVEPYLVPEPVPEERPRMFGRFAIDTVRAAGWWGHDQEERSL